MSLVMDKRRKIRVRRKKSLLMLMLMLTLFIGASMTTKPAKAEGTRIYVSQPQGYIPGVPVGNMIMVDVYIESPSTWDNTIDGIVGWAFDVKVDPAVLEVMGAKGAKSGYFLFDFLETYGYDWEGYTVSLLIGSMDKEAGTMTAISEMIMGWETLGKGAGGSGKLVTLGFKSRSEIDYSLIDILNAYYYTPAGKFPVDIVDDGYYNAPPTPEFPLGAAFQVGLIVAVAYVWWTRRRKLKVVP